eukprot:1006234_1
MSSGGLNWIANSSDDNPNMPFTNTPTFSWCKPNTGASLKPQAQELAELQSMSYTWNIADSTLITQIKTAKQGQKFRSPVFSMFHFRWYLELWPNGQQ